MRFKSTTKLEDLVLDGIKIEGDVVNNTFNRVQFTDSNGGIVVVRLGQYSQLSVEVPEPPKKEARFFVKTELGGVSVELGPYETQYKAQAKKDELPSEIADKATIEEREVEVTE